MALAYTFPMLDGPAIPYELAQLLYAAYARLHGEQRSMARISEQGGFSWTEVPTLFNQLKRKDRPYADELMSRARNLVLTPEDDLRKEMRAEVEKALREGPQLGPKDKPPAEPDVLLPEGEDLWLTRNQGQELPPLDPEDMLTIVCWKWKQSNYKIEFTAQHVNTLAAMIKRCYNKPHRIVCITDDPKGINGSVEPFPLWEDHGNLANISGKHLPSCYRRLRIFDPQITDALGAKRVMSIDLDVVLTGDVSHIFDRPDPFVGWKVPGVHVAEVYNGSMFMFTPGPYSWIWETFDPVKSPKLAKQAGYQGSDQAWLSYCLKAREPGWSRHDGVYSYPREVRQLMGLPTNARLVIFHGAKKPWDQRYSRDRVWIQKHYK